MVRRTFWPMKVVPTWKKFEKRCFKDILHYVIQSSTSSSVTTTPNWLVFCTRSLLPFLFLTISLQFISFCFFKSFITSSLHLLYDLPLALLLQVPNQSSLITRFISSILFICPHHFILCSFVYLTLRLLMSYIYGAPSKARNANVVYIWTYVWQRWNSLFLFAA